MADITITGTTLPADDPEILEDLGLIRDDDDLPSNQSGNTPFPEIVEARMSRRRILAGLGAAAAFGLVGQNMVSRRALAAGARSTLGFTETPHVYDSTHHVAPGYDAKVLLRWGDAVEAGAPPFDPMNQTAAAQAKQFGYNCDYIGFLPLPAGSKNGDRGLLTVNHEYTNPHLMFPDVARNQKLTKAQAEIEMAAHGHSIVEIVKQDGAWTVVGGSKYNRRIHVGTPMRISGPAAGHDRLKTNADATGTMALGTINDCAGGHTPWGTVLIAEENFHGYFGGDPGKTSEARNYKRYGLNAKSRYSWADYHDRFNLEKEPNEPNRFGWMVEIDPYDPESTPVKRTALGRFKHEGATTVINRDGRIVVYTGDDQRFDYIYKFVSSGRYDANNRAANSALLDNGTLFVAKFSTNGRLDWLPLVWGASPLTAVNGFNSQADVMIETRYAADLLGATPMDRPEDVEPNPVTGTVYVMLTNNSRRKANQIDAVNPRPNNRHGHILEMVPPGRGADADHAAQQFSWEIPLMAGNPAEETDGAKYHAGVSSNGWLSNPDNCAFDSKGRLWIATDGAPKSGIAEGVWATDVEDEGRMLTKRFFAAPRGAELCGPCFTPDDRTFFAAVQHPGDEKDSTFANPSTRWPDFRDDMPTRPSVVVITKADGGVIGS